MLFYEHQNCRFVILEGIMKAEWYQPLFTFARELFGDQIIARILDNLGLRLTLTWSNTWLNTHHPYLSVKKMPKGSGEIPISTQKILKK